MKTPNTITPFLFGESAIRTIIRQDGPWFVIPDVCKVLEHSNPRMLKSQLHPDDVSIAYAIDTVGREQEMNICNESGLYQLIFQSRKPAAKEFTRWVTKEVIPTLRKHGSFGKRSNEVLGFVRELVAMGFGPKEATRLTLTTFPPLSIREYRMQELEEMNAQARATGSSLTADHLLLLSIMRPGVSYTIADFKAFLPAGHALTKGTKHVAASKIGKMLHALAGAGKIVKAEGTRLATYTLAESQEKIIPLER